MGERTDHRLEVLQSVCRVCHRIKTAKQSAEARALRPVLRLARDPESHPGLVPPDTEREGGGHPPPFTS